MLRLSLLSINKTITGNIIYDYERSLVVKQHCSRSMFMTPWLFVIRLLILFGNGVLYVFLYLASSF